MSDSFFEIVFLHLYHPTFFKPPLMSTMQNCKELIRNKKYRNWVKCTLGIQQTSKALHVYVHEKFLLYLQGNTVGTNPTYYLTEDECSHFRNELASLFRQDLKCLYRIRNNRLLFSNQCSKCENTIRKILLLHKGYQGNGNLNDWDVHLENSNVTKDLTPEWAIAKIFMPKGNANNKEPKDTDPSAMFILMKMCELFTNAINEPILNRVIQARNNLFHSSDNLVDDSVAETYFDSMISLLEKALNDPDIDTYTRMKQRISADIIKIKKLNESEMTVTLFEDVEKAIRIKRTGIFYDFERRLCDNDPKQLGELFKLSGKLQIELESLYNDRREN